MADLLTLEHLTSLILLIMLQAVLGLDNLLYISIASKQAPEKDQARVRTVGIACASACCFCCCNLFNGFKTHGLPSKTIPILRGLLIFTALLC